MLPTAARDELVAALAGRYALGTRADRSRMLDLILEERRPERLRLRWPDMQPDDLALTLGVHRQLRRLRW